MSIDNFEFGPFATTLETTPPGSQNAFSSGVGAQTLSGTATTFGAIQVPRVTVLPTATSITPNADSTDLLDFNITSAASTLTVNNPIGKPADGQKIILRIKSTNSQTYSWGNQYRGSASVALPNTTTGSSSIDYLAFAYHKTDNKWDLLAKNSDF